MAFKGKHAIVTGGASGIGFQVVKQLLQHGVNKVAIIDIQDNSEDIVMLRAAFTEQQVMVINMDVSNTKGIESTYEEILKSFGHIDLVVNVAGIFNDQDIQSTLMVNLGGVINSTLAAMKRMSKDNGGKGGMVCNISSIASLDPIFLAPIYSAAKAGVLHFTRCMGTEIYYKRSGVKFITVCPGGTNTELFNTYSKNLLFPDMTDLCDLLHNRVSIQSAEDVAQCIIQTLEKEQNGAVYVISEKRLIPIDMKCYNTDFATACNEL